MKIAVAQINPVVGDIRYNRDKTIDYINRAAEQGAALAIFPELSLIGYPPLDLLFNLQLIDDNITALNEVAGACSDCGALVGFACRHTG
ncbi:nitrilase-related carbon-nitrogen hydrolase, partial [Planctomycetota bacterium]